MTEPKFSVGQKVMFDLALTLPWIPDESDWQEGIVVAVGCNPLGRQYIVRWQDYETSDEREFLFRESELHEGEEE